ncbi:helix-turn-helix domain-containing protein [Virgibacillus flavescens]|uniref:helix-turn-helix domain-containing protein n=1 Tax=Virgibacillus flavescens TaxID=1611422 RepID=UPI003D356583
MLLEGVILKSSLQFNQNRTSSAIYHLLTGKKSIQTVQDAHIYQLKKFYGIYRSLYMKDFDKALNKLHAAGLLIIAEDKSIIVTPSGINWLNNHYEKLKLNYFNGIFYHASSQVFYDRLLLLVQTLSNSCNKHYSFIPIIDNPTISNWVRAVYSRLGMKRENYFSKLYEDLQNLLVNLTDEEASIYVDRLTGYNQYGMSKDQLAHFYQKEKLDISILLERINHTILHIIHQNPKQYPAIKLILIDLTNKQFITNSARQTYQLLMENYSLSEIGEKRRLKKNTVYDHVVEVALFTHDFPVSKYVSEAHQEQILEAVKLDKTYKLKTIKENVEPNISYFQIRLMLATIQNVGEKNEQ